MDSHFSGWPVEVHVSDNRGRYLVATRDIAEGEVILRSDMFAAAVLSSHRKRICRQCLAVAFHGHHSLKCGGCGQVYWCSEACRQQHSSGTRNSSAADAWQATQTAVSHSLVCPFLLALASCKFDVDMESVFAMLADILARRCALFQYSQCHSTEGALPQQAEALEGNGSTERTNQGSVRIEDFLQLEGHVEEMLKDKRDLQQWNKGARLLMHHFLQDFPNAKQVQDMYCVSARTLIKWASMILCNNFALNYNKATQAGNPLAASSATAGEEIVNDCITSNEVGSVNPLVEAGANASRSFQAVEDSVERLNVAEIQAPAASEQAAEAGGSAQVLAEPPHADGQPPGQQHGTLCCGRAVYMTASYFNHSCRPNCTVLTNLRAAEVLGTTPIRAGEEVNFSYIDTDLPRSERQKTLRREFFFTCACTRCVQEEAEGSEKYTFVRSVAARSTKPKPRGRKARISRK